MKLSYDLTASALYISLSYLPVARTRQVDDNTSVDLDDAGCVVGIEVISLRHRWPLTAILRDYSIPPGDAAQLRAYFQPSQAGLPQQEAPTGSIGANAPVLVGAGQ